MSTQQPADAAANASLFILQDNIHEPIHDLVLWTLRQHRDHQVTAIPEWEELRELASKIKEYTLTHLDQYLEQFELNATKRGAQVHWARDAAEHNEIVHSILLRPWRPAADQEQIDASGRVRYDALPGKAESRWW